MERAISCLGLVVMVCLAWSVSSNRRKFPLRVVVGGVLLQFAFALIVLWTPPGRYLFDAIGVFFANMIEFVEAGTSFVFGVGEQPGDPDLPPRVTLVRTFAFGVLPTIIFFSSFMAILYYMGVMQWIVAGLARVMQKTLGTSGAETLSAAANVLVGHTEAPLVIRPYLPGLTTSELNAVMVGGFATVSGGLLAAYAAQGIDPGHLVTASVISAPAALVVAKIMEPETGTPETLGKVKVVTTRKGTNLLEAAAIGATEGLKLALNVAAMLIAFLALIAMLDALLGWIGLQFGFATEAGEPIWSLTAALAVVFAPIAWLLGIPWDECLEAGQVLGLKMAANEVIAYEQLGSWIRQDRLSDRTQYVMTYALSGFSNFAAIGIQIGGIGGLVPDRREDLARLGLRAMIGGTLACLMTACVAGILL